MPSPAHPTHANEGLSAEEAEQLRNLLARHDARPENRPADIDLNNPPKLPYKHQDFPRMVYAPNYDGDVHSHPDSTPQQKRDMTLVVKDQESLDSAIADGYLLDPPSQASEEEVISPRKSRKKSE